MRQKKREYLESQRAATLARMAESQVRTSSIICKILIESVLGCIACKEGSEPDYPSSKTDSTRLSVPAASSSVSAISSYG